MSSSRSLPRIRVTSVALLLALLLAALPRGAGYVPAAHAKTDATIVVNTFIDEFNAGGNCSLREAIKAASDNAAVGGCPAGTTAEDTVQLSAGTYLLTLNGAGDDTGVTGDLDLKGTMRLTVPDLAFAEIIVGGDWNDRLLHVHQGADVRAGGITLRGGRASGNGGTLLNQGTLTFRRGGLIGGVATTNGGGLFNAPGATMTLDTSSVISATARLGGGIRNEGTLDLLNSTVSRNASRTSGGGISNVGQLRLYNVTIASNIADADVVSPAGSGGGIQSVTGGTVTFQNTIIAANDDRSSPKQVDCTGVLESGDYNLISNLTGCTVVGQTAHDHLGVGAQLARLAPVGAPAGGSPPGRFFVHALLPASPAFEGGNPAGCLGPDGQPLTTDQRGAPRVQRFVCDIGAFELPEIVVTTTADGVTDNGDCTLREAIHATLLDAAVDACPPGFGDDLIRLPAGTYNLTIGPGPFHGGDLLIQKSVTIVGAGRDNTIIDGLRQDRVIQTAGAGTHVTLSNLRLRNGESKGGASGGGLAIGAGSVVTVTDSAITANRAANLGGGILVGAANGAGTLMLIRTVVADNQALGTAGGGLSTTTGSSATVIASTIRDNTSGGNGAGIFNNGTLRLERSTVSGNIAPRDGGALSNNGTAVLVNATISGNRAAMRAGGIVNFNTVDLNNVTIHRNTADSDGNNDGDGGGILNNAGATARVRNTIIAGNFDLSTATQPPVRDCSGALTSQGHNLLGDPTGCSGLTNGVQGDKVGTSSAPLDPALNALAFNGAGTKSHLPRATSPALDAGNPTAPGSGGNACADIDQRGTARPQDANDDGTARCDIGAVEVATVGISTLAPSSGVSRPEVVSTFTLSWTHPVRWRLLDNLDLRFAAGDEVILWVRYSEGFDPDTATDTSTFSLLDAEGEVIATGRPGEDAVFETEWGALHLEQSSFQGTGAEGPDVTVHFAVSFTEAAAGRFYDLEVLASDDEGAIQGADEMGIWGVSPFDLYLPFVTTAPSAEPES